MMGKVLSKCQSIIEKSSLVTTAGTDECAECTFSVDYIKTASSCGGEGYSSELSMQHLLTGGAADGWYQASLPLPSSPLTTLCFGSLMQPSCRKLKPLQQIQVRTACLRNARLCDQQ